MIKEVDVQSIIIDAVEANGGKGTKLSNRFLVGVADLLIKLPGVPLAVIEVKLEHLPKRFNGEHEWKLAVTKPQEEFLLGYHEAGARALVLSVVIGSDRTRKQMAILAMGIDTAIARGYHVRFSDHTPLGGPTDRNLNIAWYLKERINRERANRPD